MLSVANSIKFMPSSSSSSPGESGGLRFRFSASEDVVFRQKTAWRYRLRANNSYIFEVARYDTFGPCPPYVIGQPFSTEWGASVYNLTWDETLSANASLRIGLNAKWNPTLGTFFPTNNGSHCSESGHGFADYLHGVNSLVEFFNLPESLFEPETRD